MDSLVVLPGFHPSRLNRRISSVMRRHITKLPAFPRLEKVLVTDIKRRLERASNCLKGPENEASEIWPAPLPRDQGRFKSFCPALSKIFPDPLYGKMGRIRRWKDSFINRNPIRTYISRTVGFLAMAAAIHFWLHFLDMGCSIQSPLEITGLEKDSWRVSFPHAH